MRSLRSVLSRAGRISVAMATYDGERYLPEMLESLANADTAPDELVVRDDGSSDRTLDVVHDFAARAPFAVHVVPSDDGRLGYAQNFVAASRACTGDLLFFADQDDAWRPEKLDDRRPGRVATARSPRCSTTSACRPRTGRRSRRRTPVCWPSGASARSWPSRGAASPSPAASSTPGTGRRRSSPVSHDFWVTLLATAFGQRRILPDILIDHRIHDRNTSGWIPDQNSREFTRSGDGASDVDLLIDLVVKPPRVRGLTATFLDVVASAGRASTPRPRSGSRQSLRANRRHHRERRRAGA